MYMAINRKNSDNFSYWWISIAQSKAKAYKRKISPNPMRKLSWRLVILSASNCGMNVKIKMRFFPLLLSFASAANSIRRRCVLCVFTVASELDISFIVIQQHRNKIIFIKSLPRWDIKCRKLSFQQTTREAKQTKKKAISNRYIERWTLHRWCMCTEFGIHHAYRRDCQRNYLLDVLIYYEIAWHADSRSRRWLGNDF